MAQEYKEQGEEIKSLIARVTCLEQPLNVLRKNPSVTIDRSLEKLVETLKDCQALVASHKNDSFFNKSRKFLRGSDNLAKLEAINVSLDQALLDLQVSISAHEMGDSERRIGATAEATVSLLEEEKARRAREAVLQCVQCGEDFKESGNAEGACRFHPAPVCYFNHKLRLSCCDVVVAAQADLGTDSGCVRGRHAVAHHQRFPYAAYFTWMRKQREELTEGVWESVCSEDFETGLDKWVRVGALADGRCFVWMGKGAFDLGLRFLTVPPRCFQTGGVDDPPPVRPARPPRPGVPKKAAAAAANSTTTPASGRSPVLNGARAAGGGDGGDGDDDGTDVIIMRRGLTMRPGEREDKKRADARTWECVAEWVVPPAGAAAVLRLTARSLSAAVPESKEVTICSSVNGTLQCGATRVLSSALSLAAGGRRYVLPVARVGARPQQFPADVRTRQRCEDGGEVASHEAVCTKGLNFRLKVLKVLANSETSPFEADRFLVRLMVLNVVRSGQSGSTSEERLAILKMVADKKVSVQEGVALLTAVENSNAVVDSAKVIDSGAKYFDEKDGLWKKAPCKASVPVEGGGPATAAVQRQGSTVAESCWPLEIAPRSAGNVDLMVTVPAPTKKGSGNWHSRAYVARLRPVRLRVWLEEMGGGTVSGEVEYVNPADTFNEREEGDLAFFAVDDLTKWRRFFVRVTQPPANKSDASLPDGDRQLFIVSLNGSVSLPVTPKILRQWGYESRKAGAAERVIETLSIKDPRITTLALTDLDQGVPRVHALRFEIGDLDGDNYVVDHFAVPLTP